VKDTSSLLQLEIRYETWLPNVTEVAPPTLLPGSIPTRRWRKGRHQLSLWFVVRANLRHCCTLYGRSSAMTPWTSGYTGGACLSMMITSANTRLALTVQPQSDLHDVLQHLWSAHATLLASSQKIPRFTVIFVFWWAYRFVRFKTWDQLKNSHPKSRLRTHTLKSERNLTLHLISPRDYAALRSDLHTKVTEVHVSDVGALSSDRGPSRKCRPIVWAVVLHYDVIALS